MLNKVIKIIFRVIVILAILIVAILFAGKLYFSIPVSEYYKVSRPAFNIPGLSDGYVPQGLEYLADGGKMLFTGYNKDGGPSPVYVVDPQDGRLVATATLALQDGTIGDAHNGGMAVHNGLLYICDGHVNGLRVFRMDELLAIEGKGMIKEIGMVPLEASGDSIGPAFVEAGAEGLIVGEFYIAKAYETPLSHYVGDHHALAVVLPYDDSMLGVSSTPVMAYSLPDKAQGMCFDHQGVMYISESWGVDFSTVEAFAPEKPDGEINVLGVTVPMTFLGENNRIHAAKLAPMAEEMAIVGDEMFINCESASRKYFFGLLNGADKIYATDIRFFRGE